MTKVIKQLKRLKEDQQANADALTEWRKKQADKREAMVEKMIKSPIWKNTATAAAFLEETIAPLWRPRLGWSDGDVFVDQLRRCEPGWTDTATLLVHVAARSVLATSGRWQLPRVAINWCGTQVEVRGLKTREYMAIVGRTKAQVDLAKRKIRYAAHLLDTRCAAVLEPGPGIGLFFDMFVREGETQELLEYAAIRDHGHGRRIDCGKPYSLQMDWCDAVAPGARNFRPDTTKVVIPGDESANRQAGLQ